MKNESDALGEMHTADGKTMDEEAKDSVQMLGYVFLVVMVVAIPCAFWLGWNLGNLVAAVVRTVR